MDLPPVSDKKMIKDKITILDLSEPPMYEIFIGFNVLDQL